MKKKTQRFYILLELLLIVFFVCSCSDKDTSYDEIVSVEKTSLSISLNSSMENETRSSGNLGNNDDKKIYSIAVLVFKSNTGELDGSEYINREIIAVSGENYDKEYKEIKEVKGISITAGERDIYVVANAPNNYFSTVTNLSTFREKYEELSTQGLYNHPEVVTTALEDDPIGGVNPTDKKTNLTMCSYLRNILFDNTQNQHYLGYTDNGGRPLGVTEGSVLNEGKAFELERLAARVAIRKIDFDLPANLEFEKGHPTNAYTYQIDSVFMLNVKTASAFYVDGLNQAPDVFGHGSSFGINCLQKTTYSRKIRANSFYTNYLNEPLSTKEYDISVNDRPLWFYVFENNESAEYPTSFVICVQFNFRSSIDNTLKTVKAYYPIVVNANGLSKGTADHNYIKRNCQYSIGVKIMGLGLYYDTSNITTLRFASENTADFDIELEERVGENLFPWIGNTYY